MVAVSLQNQYLRDSVNDRSDEWGGSLENRTRLLAEVVAAVVAEAGAGRTGVRLSPVSPVNDSGQDSQPQATYGRAVERLVQRLAPQRLAFLHVVEGQTGGARDIAPFDYAAMRRTFGGPWMVNNGYDRAMALARLAQVREALGETGLAATHQAEAQRLHTAHREQQQRIVAVLDEALTGIDPTKV